MEVLGNIADMQSAVELATKPGFALDDLLTVHQTLMRNTAPDLGAGSRRRISAPDPP